MARLIKLAAWTCQNLTGKCLTLAGCGVGWILMARLTGEPFVHSLGVAAFIVAAAPVAFVVLVALLPWE